MRNLWMEALTQKVHKAGRTVNVSVAVATVGIHVGKREVVGLATWGRIRAACSALHSCFYRRREA